MQALVLDLRYNPGGLLNSARRRVRALPRRRTHVVVSTEGRMPSQKQDYATLDDPKGNIRNIPLAILINGGSASGAEIVAGALKDLNRAILVGETTFGKGSVQSVIQLPDGSALRLTTAKYYTPSKQVIHEHGVSPNIRATLTDRSGAPAAAQRREDALGDLEKKELAGFHDTQLERAVDALKGAMIYAQRTGEKPAAAPVSCVLAIETSCDETAVAILRGAREKRGRFSRAKWRRKSRCISRTAASCRRSPRAAISRSFAR